jgi:REP element-mobilizing transposase RayT
MPNTLGYHFVKSGYGLWLPGDDRGHWSEAWDDEIGYTEPHKLHPGDPIRRRMAEERMKHPPVRLTEAMARAVVDAIGECVRSSEGGLTIVAAAIEPTHTHLLIRYSGRDIDKTSKWLADQTTKAIHRHTNHQGSVWGKGKWCSYVFDEGHGEIAMQYIERHNLRHGRAAKPYPFIL